ncbi:hypothetical protein T11_4995 [Trichinella zimbabwensis]|uniref:Uncharacterized protein n=1 Tax=Trichinella zimbabwensis TaxID=268475 RepID=A0A0V1G804_9BILA|nr:hypothetical protein T11_4995 [Trichinella zimbabwensis]
MTSCQYLVKYAIWQRATKNFVAIAFAVIAFCVIKRFSKCFDGYGF